MKQKLTLQFAFILLAASCSTAEKTKAPAKKIYSSSTEREFRSIEMSELRNSQPQAPIPQKEQTIAPVPKVINKPVETKLSIKNEERMQEINQNLAFYCMKHRKDPIFKTEEKCLSFTRKVLNNCEKKHQSANSVFLSCIKAGLQKRDI
ncbi:MAG: hypothetical protein WC635_00785 [Bacteriovorax sp.]|jgi:uncharacterized lipoprotein